VSKPPYALCWWCNYKFTAGGKYAREMRLPSGPVYVHVRCVPKVAAHVAETDVTHPSAGSWEGNS
jgi:hypothetical protein